MRVYTEKSNITDKKQLGNQKDEIVFKSSKKVDNKPKNLTSVLTERLLSTKCKYTSVSNNHIYTEKADTADGIYRICHLEENVDDSEIIISEYHESSGAMYSAYFKVLISELKKNGICRKNSKTKKYTVKSIDIDKFITCLNNIVANEKLGTKYKLKVDKENPVCNKNNLYNRVYWE